ncbi:MAG: alpha/beta hydrolase [Alphaproteobacteria bacterium]|nr:alpha/beta hydrolase [Alphaproteobacteria bacterium]
MSFDPERKTARIPGRGVFSYLAWGLEDRSKPLLHFAHATGFNAMTYRHMLAPLTDHFRVIAMDQRGHGMTEAEADPKKLKRWTTYRDDLAGFLDLLGEPVMLAGHSMGGAASVLAAGQYPDQVPALLLVEPVIPSVGMARGLRIRRWFGLKRHTPLAVGAKKRRADFSSKDAMFRAYRGRGAFATWPDRFLQDYIDGGTKPAENGDDDAITLACAPAWEAGTFLSVSHDLWKQIRKVQCPTSVLYAARESTLMGDGPLRLREMFPKWRIEKIVGTTHFLPMERPELVQDELIALAERAKLL